MIPHLSKNDLPEGEAIDVNSDVAVLNDGSIVFASTSNGPAATRLLANGMVDTSYGAGGRAYATTTSTNFHSRIALDGSVVFTGPFAVRIDASGQPDLTFSGDGQFDSTDLPQINPPSNTASFQPDGAILIPGYSNPGNGGLFEIVRLLGAGPIGFASAATGGVQAGGTADGSSVTLNPSGSVLTQAGKQTFFPGFPGDVRTATADVTGDGVPDFIGGAGPGGGPNVIVYDGATGARIADFFPFETTFTGGVFVAAGDINGDGKADLAVTPDQGGGPIVAIYDGAKLAAGLNAGAQIARFFGIDDPNFRGGARAAVGDVNGDGKGDILVSAGFTGGPREALFNGAGLTPSGAPPKLVPDFFAFEDTLRNGAYVALGDLNGDGKAELIFGGGPGGGPRVRIFDGAKLLAAGSFQSLDEIPTAQAANFFAADSTSRGGIRLAVGTVDGKASLITGSGENEPGQVRVFSNTTLFGSNSPAPDQVLDVFNGTNLPDGVFVG